ncbi:MAG: cell division ATP-binding protein FtsE [Vallitaleaceae bacterium]|nr:cell division ATP-binding protein FtsE [Vallitaleaceae bacterium]
MLRLENVTKTYPNGVIALNSVNLNIEKGEFVFIVGSSGSGKSTLIKLIMQELKVTSGQLYIEGQDVTHISRRKIPKLRRKMGVVFQDFRLLDKMTVYSNVAFAMKVTETPARKIRRMVPTVLSMVGLGKKMKRYPNQLSGGEQQRTALARALVNNPHLLLADEPTGNLDPKTSWEIVKLLIDINLRGTTVIIVTHDSEIVNAMKKRVVTLKDGHIVKDEQRGDYGYEH